MGINTEEWNTKNGYEPSLREESAIQISELKTEFKEDLGRLQELVDIKEQHLRELIQTQKIAIDRALQFQEIAFSNAITAQKEFSSTNTNASKELVEAQLGILKTDITNLREARKQFIITIIVGITILVLFAGTIIALKI